LLVQAEINKYGSPEARKAQKFLEKYGGSHEKRKQAKIAKYGSEEGWRRHETLKKNQLDKCARQAKKIAKYGSEEAWRKHQVERLKQARGHEQLGGLPVHRGVHTGIVHSGLKQKHLKDAGFNKQVRQPLIAALVAARLIDDPTNPKWKNMTAEQLARVLADAKLNAADFADPAVAAAILLADRIARGDTEAAKELVATCAVGKVSAEMAKMGDVSLNNSEFNSDARKPLMRALVAAGIVDDPTSAKWRDMSAEELARVLALANRNPSDFSDPVVASAIRLAQQIAAGDSNAAKELVAVTKVCDELSLARACDCTATLAGEARVGDVATITVTATDGQLVADKIACSIWLEGSDSLEATRLVVRNLSAVDISWVPRCSGNHKIRVLVGGEDVRGGLTVVQVNASAHLRCSFFSMRALIAVLVDNRLVAGLASRMSRVMIGPGLQNSAASVPYCFCIQARDSHGNPTRDRRAIRFVCSGLPRSRRAILARSWPCWFVG
jgi:hypothetical protein